MKYSFIAIEGNIGAGKSTLASKLSSHLRADLLEEPFEENPLLPAFYADPKTSAYALEISFLMDRFRDLKKRLRAGNRVVADYWFHKSMIFAKTNLGKIQLAQFEELFQSLDLLLPAPDLIIYYHRTIDKVKGGIYERGRDYEKAIPDKYLQKLEKNYRIYLKKHRNVPVLWLEGDRFHPARNRAHFQQLLDFLELELKAGLNMPETRP